LLPRIAGLGFCYLLWVCFPEQIKIRHFFSYIFAGVFFAAHGAHSHLDLPFDNSFVFPPSIDFVRLHFVQYLTPNSCSMFLVT
jgi:hypothetical protein